MAGRSRIVGGVLVASIAVLLSGCVNGSLASAGGPSAGLQLADIDAGTPPRLARSQVPESGAPPPRQSMTLPAPQPNLLPGASPIQPATAIITSQQAATLIGGSKLRVQVRAWVNGRPIFDDELMHAVGPFLMEAASLPEPQRGEKVAEMFSTALEHMIDQEVMYQDAVRKLEKHNPQALRKLKDMVEQEFDKRLKKMRDAGVPEDKINAFKHTAHTIMERDLISNEYARSRISGPIQARVNLELIEDYYKTHQTEFAAKDRVQWQDVFIAVGPKHPTIADARRFAEELLARCQTPEDFAKIQAYDDGDSKLRGGEGTGQQLVFDKNGAYLGDIRPQALAPYLAQLKDGQVGPVVEIGTGVHIFRVLKRDYAGLQPMSNQVQKVIRRKLESELAEREYKQLVREMRSRAVIRIVRDVP